MFIVGDRVVCDRKANPIIKGMIGTIVKITPREMLIDFDDWLNGHDGNGVSGARLPQKSGWWISLKSAEKRFELIDTTPSGIFFREANKRFSS